MRRLCVISVLVYILAGSLYVNQIPANGVQDTAIEDTQSVQNNISTYLVDRALQYMDANKSKYGLGNLDKDLYGAEVKKLVNNVSTIRFYQRYNNVPVYSGTILITFDSNLNVMWEKNDLEPELEINTLPSISSEQAMTIAREGLKASCDKPDAGEPKLFIYNPKFLDQPVLAWRVGLMCKDTNEPWAFWVNAHSGEIIYFHSQRRIDPR